jgi:serpin B
MRCIIFLNSAAALWLAMAAAGDVANAAAGESTTSPTLQTSATPLDAAYLNKVQSNLGFRLIVQLSGHGKGDGNLIVSPASLASVMALLDLGAMPEMRVALLKSLAFEKSPDEAAADKLAALRASTKSGQAEKGGPLTAANAIVFDPKAAPFPNKVRELAGAGAQVSIDDLSDPAAIRRINHWVNERTSGLIPFIIDKGPRESGLVALNALHFKDRWKDAFDRNATRQAPFHSLAGSVVEVPMMQREGSMHFREQGTFVAVELPYANDRFRLVLITSKVKPARAVEFRPVVDWLGGEGFAQGMGELALPRFGLGARADLLEPLDALGLSPARTSPRALSGFSPVAMTIAQVIQRTEIRVDEAGTQAAAATAVTTTRGAASDLLKVVVDKPFLFALRDAQSGLMLLTGYVDNPKGGAR